MGHSTDRYNGVSYRTVEDERFVPQHPNKNYIITNNNINNNIKTASSLLTSLLVLLLLVASSTLSVIHTNCVCVLFVDVLLVVLELVPSLLAS